DALVQKSVLDVLLVCLLLALMSGPIADPERFDAGRRWLVVGVTLGALGLTRENALVFVPVIAGWLWVPSAETSRLRGKGFEKGARVFSRALLALLSGVAIVLLPVGLRNLAVGGEFHLTTAQSGPNFYIGNHAHADGMYMPLRAGRGSPE